MDSIISRRSIRRFKLEPVPRELIEAVAEAGRLAPSAKNRQPWKYIVYQGRAKAGLLEVMAAALRREQDKPELLPECAWGLPDAFNTLRIMQEAPVLIMVMNINGGSPFAPIDRERRLAEISDSLAIGASVENMLLRGTELGLGSLWIGNTCFAYEALAEFIGERGQLAGAVALGYPAEQPPARPRKALAEILEYR